MYSFQSLICLDRDHIRYRVCAQLFTRLLVHLFVNQPRDFCIKLNRLFMMGRDHKNNKSPKSIESVLSQLSDEKLCGNFDDIFHLIPVTKKRHVEFHSSKVPNYKSNSSHTYLNTFYFLTCHFPL